MFTLTKSVAIGIHSGNGNVLAKVGDHKPEQLCSRSWYNEKTLKPDVDQVQLKQLYKAKKAAEAAYDKFIEANHIDLRVEVRKQLGISE